jgi:DMSO/TMAO reductase YedYZ molybdopterin-dependent catalytic subunit
MNNIVKMPCKEYNFSVTINKLRENDMRKRSMTWMIILLLIFTSACSFTGNQHDTQTQATLARFRVGEIKDYQGKLLSPAVGPRDNSISGVQQIDIRSYRLKISGLVAKELDLTYDEVLAHDKYTRLITLHCVEGWTAQVLWEGVLLDDLIKLANPDLSVNTVIFHASDGYTTSLPYAEIKQIQMILAFNANGIALPPEMGYPFIVVAESKYGYKWARWVTEIELSSDPSYKGYWESRGYSNQGDLTK